MSDKRKAAKARQAFQGFAAAEGMSDAELLEMIAGTHTEAFIELRLALEDFGAALLDSPPGKALRRLARLLNKLAHPS